MKILITEKQLNRILLNEEVEVSLGPPVAGRLKISSPYGNRVHPISKKTRQHHGVDIGVKSGTEVLSPADGVVIKAQCTQGACGGNIFIDHGAGLKTRYCHIKDIKVNKGDSVTKGQVIGLSGGRKRDYCPGSSTGAHLHYEVYDKAKGSSTTDPMPYLDGVTIKRKGRRPKEKIDIQTIPDGNLTLSDGMRRGRRHVRDNVKEMQIDLIARNYILPKFGMDGKFGPETLAAVNAFQKDHGFQISDMITPQVLTAMKDPKKINLNPDINDPTTVKKLERKGVIEPDANFILPLKGRKYPGNQQIDSNHVIRFFVNKGLTPEQAAGIAGNMKSESNFKTGTIGDGGTSMGLAQWHDSRLYRLNDFAKQQEKSITDPDAQLEYLWSELQGKEKKAYNALLTTTNASDAGASFMVNFERPGNQSRANQNKRGRQAQDALDKYPS